MADFPFSSAQCDWTDSLTPFMNAEEQNYENKTNPNFTQPLQQSCQLLVQTSPFSIAEAQSTGRTSCLDPDSNQDCFALGDSSMSTNDLLQVDAETESELLAITEASVAATSVLPSFHDFYFTNVRPNSPTQTKQEMNNQDPMMNVNPQVFPSHPSHSGVGQMSHTSIDKCSISNNNSIVSSTEIPSTSSSRSGQILSTFYHQTVKNPSRGLYRGSSMQDRSPSDSPCSFAPRSQSLPAACHQLSPIPMPVTFTNEPSMVTYAQLLSEAPKQ